MVMRFVFVMGSWMPFMCIWSTETKHIKED